MIGRSADNIRYIAMHFTFFIPNLPFIFQSECILEQQQHRRRQALSKFEPIKLSLAWISAAQVVSALERGVWDFKCGPQ